MTMKPHGRVNKATRVRRAMEDGAKSATILIIATLGLVIALSVYGGINTSASALAAGPNHKGPTIPNGHVFAPPPAPQASPRLGPKVCNSWISPDGASGKPITATYGEIRNCELVGGDWVVATLGSPTQSSAIGVDACDGNTNCLDGRTARDIHAWTFYPAPFVGGVTILQVTATGTLIVDNGGHELKFDLATGQYQP